MVDYETPETKWDEKDIIERLSKVFNWTSHTKMQTTDVIDYLVSNGSKIVAVVEVKKRNIMFDKFSNIYLSENKMNAGFYFSNMFKRYDCSFIFAIKTLDNKIYYIKITKDMPLDIRFETVSSGVTEIQVERVAHIPTNLFQLLNENN